MRMGPTTAVRATPPFRLVSSTPQGSLEFLQNAAAALVQKCSAPMYADNGYTWEPSGTAVFASLGGRTLLLTARHCLECIRDGDVELVLAVDKLEVRVERPKYAWPRDRKGRLDTCVLQLPCTSEAWRAAQRRECVSLVASQHHDVRARAPAHAYEAYLFVGYPGERHHCDHLARTVRPGPVVVFSSARTAEFSVDQIVLDVKTSETLPHLDGMSGAGVWLMRAVRTDNTIDFRLVGLELVGVLHTHVGRRHKVFASPIPPVFAAAADLVGWSP